VSKILLSFTTPRMEPLLELAYPTYERFARSHGYELRIERPTQFVDTEPRGRHSLRWHKISMLSHAIVDYSVVLWIDSDAFFLRCDRDIADDVPAQCFQGLVIERLAGRTNPNTGIWLLRGCAMAVRFLRRVQEIGQPNHSWADQAAVCRALGWHLGDYHGHGAAPGTPTRFARATTWLPSCWNSIGDGRSNARIRHLPGMTIVDRRRAMRAELGHVIR
jgi:hypothetical protein